MSESTLQPIVGLFPVSFDVGTHKPGAQQLHVDLLVNTPRQRLAGAGTLTQAINPPLDLTFEVAGEYTYLGLIPPTEARILLTLQGRQSGQGVTSPIVFKAQLIVEPNWQSGFATYSYQVNGQWHTVDQVPVQLDGKRIQEQGNHDPAVRLHQATLEAAIATGDLAQLKRLASGSASAALNSAIDANKPAAKPGKVAKA
ncbi:DUF1842 domain-containing protein [Pseudomonas putida]